MILRIKPLAGLRAVLIGVALVPCLFRSGPLACAADNGMPIPAIVHDGRLLRLPAGSAYRSRIEIAPVQQQAMAHPLVLPGVIEADPALTVNVLPPLTGRISVLAVRLGDRVHAGQLLLRLQSADLIQAQADLAKARDGHEVARKALQRARAVLAEGGNAQRDVEAAESAEVQSRAELDRSVQHLQALGVSPQDADAAQGLPVTASISGTVTALNVGMGAVVNDATAALLNIANLSEVYLTAQVPESLLAQVRVGQSMDATVAAWPDRPLHGRVSQIAGSIDADTRRTRVRARVRNPGEWLHPNMYVSVRLPLPQPPAVLVPTSALVMGNDRTLVFVEVAPWTFEARQVELGLEEGYRVRVQAGLKPGERVVVRGGVLLND